jgi:hypothetical protein
MTLPVSLNYWVASLLFILTFVIHYKFNIQEEFGKWIVRDNFNEVDDHAKQTFYSSEVTYFKYQSEGSLRNSFCLNSNEMVLDSSKHNNPSTFSICIQGDKVKDTRSSIIIRLDGVEYLNKSIQEFEKNWNEYLLPPFDNIEISISGNPSSFVFEIPHLKQKKQEYKNVILIVCDALTKEDLKLYSEKGIETPHISKFFEKGEIFESAIVQGEWTTTNFAHMFSSEYSSHHLATHRFEGMKHPIHHSNKMLAEYFQEAGYFTSMFSCSKRLSSAKGYGNGFQEIITRDYQTIQNHELTYQAVDWLDRHKDSNNFIVLHYMDTHGPFNFWSNHKTTGLHKNSKPVSDVWRRENPDMFDKIYQNQIREFDLGIGFLLGYLEQYNHMEDTSVFLTSDHGQMHKIPPDDSMGAIEPLFSYRMLNVPLLVRTPNSKKLNRKTHLIEAGIDLCPSILDAAGISGFKGAGESYLKEDTHKDYAITESFYEGVVQRRIETSKYIFYRRFNWSIGGEIELICWDKVNSPWGITIDSEILNYFTQLEEQLGLINEKSDPNEYYGYFNVSDQ